MRELQKLYGGRCQLTGWNPVEEYGKTLCEAHHVHWLGRGGDDSLSNLVLLAPNIHRAIHRLDVQFDYVEQAFCFEDHLKPLVLQEHVLSP